MITFINRRSDVSVSECLTARTLSLQFPFSLLVDGQGYSVFVEQKNYVNYCVFCFKLRETWTYLLVTISNALYQVVSSFNARFLNGVATDRLEGKTASDLCDLALRRKYFKIAC